MFVVEDGKAAVRRVKTGGENGANVVDRRRPDRRRAGHRGRPAGVRPGAAVRARPVPPSRAAGLIRCSRRSSSTGRGSRSSSRSSPRSPALLALYSHPDRAISRYRSAPGLRHHQLSRRLSRRRRHHDRSADRSPGRRRRQDDLHEERERRRRQLHAHRFVRARHRSGHQHRQRQQPGADRACQPAGGRSAPGRHRQEEIVGACSA